MIKLWRTVLFAPDRDEVAVEIVTRYDDGYERNEQVLVAPDPALLGAVIAALSRAAGCDPYARPVTPADTPQVDPVVPDPVGP